MFFFHYSKHHTVDREGVCHDDLEAVNSQCSIICTLIMITDIRVYFIYIVSQ